MLYQKLSCFFSFNHFNPRVRVRQVEAGKAFPGWVLLLQECGHTGADTHPRQAPSDLSVMIVGECILGMFTMFRLCQWGFQHNGQTYLGVQGKSLTFLCAP